MKVLIIIVIFFLMNAFFIVSNKNIPLNNVENISQVSAIYIQWVRDVVKNGAEITGNAIKLKWVPQTKSS